MTAKQQIREILHRKISSYESDGKVYFSFDFEKALSDIDTIVKEVIGKMESEEYYDELLGTQTDLTYTIRNQLRQEQLRKWEG